VTDNLERLRAALADTYDIERPIGSGGMATVYLAKDIKHDRRVAVKVLRPELASALGPDRFPREIKIVAQLSHPHILPLHDSGEIDGFLYYVMPYVEDESLRGKIDKGTLSVHDSIGILREIVDAISHAHAQGIVHRDIKPDNVLTSGRHVLVADFGVAKAVSHAGGNTVTTAGLALGTPTYMAPEQAVGESDIDHRADIYAIGAMAYEMLSGKPPFAGESAQMVLSAHVVQKPKDIMEVAPHIPPQLGLIVMKCLEKRREDRWQTVDDILPQLELLGTPSGGVTPTNTRPIRVTQPKKTMRMRWPAMAAGVALVAIAAIGGWFIRGGGAAGMGADGKVDRMAVLPLTDLSGSDDFFIDGIHDALITELAQLDVVTVLSRSAVLPYKMKSATTKEIARELKVDAVLEGSVFRSGNRIRITAQLVDPETYTYIWTQSYERELGDVLTIQDEVVKAIAADIDAALSEEEVVSVGGIEGI